MLVSTLTVCQGLSVFRICEDLEKTLHFGIKLIWAIGTGTHASEWE